MTPQALMAELKRLNVKVSLNGDKLRLEAPAGVLTQELKEAVKQHKPELLALLCPSSHKPSPHSSKVVKLYRARQACLKAGYCLQLTKERDCRLFPLTWRWGWCRETLPAGKGGGARALH